ncbi:MAG: tetratricopeptide repeat protein, partial [Merismopedia sp. SIO2A8]|nr:tetratricopeptide repeat protein [Merismopedia sp. SIO2A8]
MTPPLFPASDLLISGNYSAAIAQYEQAIEVDPAIASNYWYLGLCWLLQRKEFEAQAIWYGIGAEQDDIAAWSEGLISVLKWAADQQLECSNI